MKRHLGVALCSAALLAACSDSNGITELNEGLAFAHTGPLVDPVLVAGNISGTAAEVCATVNNTDGAETWLGFKVDSNNDTNQATIEITITDGTYLAWLSSAATVKAVVIKGGQDTHVYYYNPPAADHDNGLISPPSGGGGTPEVSHYVVCYTANLQVHKTAETTFDREFEWTIEKSASEEELLLSPTQTHLVDYEVQVTKSAPIDFGHTVSGVITVSNPFDSPVEVTDVQDSMFDADLECEVTFPHTLAAGGSFECTFEVLHDQDGSNTATAISGTSGVGNGSYTANFAFGDPANTYLDCVDVSDTMVGTTVQGEICASQLFEYTIEVGPYGLPCGLFSVDNTAIVSSEGEELDASSVSIPVTVAGEGCEPEYCTLSQGYWRTHSAAGPAPYDAGWEALPGGLGHMTLFFATGKTWLEVFNTPVRGAAGIALAYQYMAAKLNILNAGGAIIPGDVEDAIDAAEAWFTGKTWDQVTARQSKAVSDMLNALAATLDDFNTGEAHCSE
jgi:hypothetical protein